MAINKSAHHTVEDYCESSGKKVSSIVVEVMGIRAEKLCAQRSLELGKVERKETKLVKKPNGQTAEEEETKFDKTYPVEILEEVFGPGVINNGA